MRPRLRDLFCGAGGCSVGYARAGFDVTGVDIEPHPDYPFALLVADALEVDLTDYDAIHASPPCQAKTTMSNRWRGAGGKADSHDWLLPAVREGPQPPQRLDGPEPRALRASPDGPGVTSLTPTSTTGR